MKSPVWTPTEIHALPDTGDWFFGLVRDESGLRPCEIFPGMGWAYGWRWTDWPTALMDVWRATR